MIKRTLISILLSFVVAGNLSCTGENLFLDMASNKDSDEALFIDAQKLIDGRDYTAAITKIMATSTDFRALPRVKDSLAGAYAARCGMEFLTFVDSLTSGSSQTFFALAMSGFVGIDTNNFDDCVQARDIIKSVGDVSLRSTSENLFLAVLGMAMLGNRVRGTADILPTALGDGTVDAGYNCGPTKVPIAYAAAIIEAFALINENLAAVADIAEGVANNLDSVATACGPDCTTITYAGTSPAETDNAIILARGMINMQDIGMGSCPGSDPANCQCTDP